MPPQSESSLIGIEFSGSKLRAATVNNDGVIGERREAQLQAEGLVAQVAQLVSDLRQNEENIEAVGIAIPGLVNRQTDRVVASRDLPGIVRENIHAELMAATGLRFELENDAKGSGTHYDRYRRLRMPMWQYGLSGNNCFRPKYCASRERTIESRFNLIAFAVGHE